MEAAYSEDTSEEVKGFAVYLASKVQGERAAWRWVEANQPGFVLNTVLPNFTVSDLK